MEEFEADLLIEGEKLPVIVSFEIIEVAADEPDVGFQGYVAIEVRSFQYHALVTLPDEADLLVEVRAVNDQSATDEELKVFKFLQEHVEEKLWEQMKEGR